MDLGYDFCLEKFHDDISHNRVFHDGPWFIGQNFLSICKWEPKFNSKTTYCKIIALWVQMSLLQTKFMLKKL